MTAQFWLVFVGLILFGIGTKPMPESRGQGLTEFLVIAAGSAAIAGGLT